MNEEETKRLSKIACKLSGMTFVLKGYCENFEEISQLSNLVEFSDILHLTSNQLFDFF